MKYGFVKVAAATPNIRVADVKFNTERILEGIGEAESSGVQLLVFPELCVCGYTCGDLFGQDVLLDGCERALAEIAGATKGKKMLVFVGLPFRFAGVLYNCAAALSGGKVIALIPKSNLPNYAEFYEKRNFTAYRGENVRFAWNGEEVVFGNKIIFADEKEKYFTVAAEICEDLWVPQSPSVSHALAGANIIVNLSASDETTGKAEYRRLLVRSQSAKIVAGYVYADAGEGESTTDMVFSGHDMIAENGEILAESKLFENGMIVSEIDVQKIAFERRRIDTFRGTSEAGYGTILIKADQSGDTLSRDVPALPFVPSGDKSIEDRAELILTMQSEGFAKRLEHTNSKSAVIGVSGGLDSALALLVAVRAFRKAGRDLKDIIAVTMPCFGTSERTLNNSLRFMEKLGVTARTIRIADSVRSHFKDISHDESVRNSAYENAQARMRTMVLMDIANDEDGLVVGTGDLSELALGWATYNGDHMSMYGVNASVPKTLVKYLIGYEAARLGGDVQDVLTDILNTEISPELLPPVKGKIAQKTESLVGPYELNDFYLYYAIRWGFTPKKVCFLAKKAFAGRYGEAEIKKRLADFYRRFFSQQFKRSCLPDGVKIGSVTLSPRGDWRMPSDAVAALWLNELE